MNTQYSTDAFTFQESFIALLYYGIESCLCLKWFSKDPLCTSWRCSLNVKIEELYSAVSALHSVRKPKLLCSIIHYMPRFCKSLLQNLQLQIKSTSLLNLMSGNYLDLLLCDIEA